MIRYKVDCAARPQATTHDLHARLCRSRAWRSRLCAARPRPTTRAPCTRLRQLPHAHTPQRTRSEGVPMPACQEVDCARRTHGPPRMLRTRAGVKIDLAEMHHAQRAHGPHHSGRIHACTRQTAHEEVDCAPRPLRPNHMPPTQACSMQSRPRGCAPSRTCAHKPQHTICTRLCAEAGHGEVDCAPRARGQQHALRVRACANYLTPTRHNAHALKACRCRCVKK